LNRALRLPLAILAILVSGIVGAVLFRVGADDKPHSVLLKWNSSAPGAGSAVTGYRVYRTQPDGTYSPIASVNAPTYVDGTVTAGTTYGYFVTSLDAAGHESRPSNYVALTVP
jgi:fibronectin type 3 domain-containing protein